MVRSLTVLFFALSLSACSTTISQLTPGTNPGVAADLVERVQKVQPNSSISCGANGLGEKCAIVDKEVQIESIKARAAVEIAKAEARARYMAPYGAIGAYGGFGSPYGYGAGFPGAPLGYGVRPTVSTRLGPYTRQDCQPNGVCVTVNEPIPPGAVPGFR